MTNIINLTPHAVNIIGEDGTVQVTFEPAGTVARASQQAEKVGDAGCRGIFAFQPSRQLLR